MSVELPQWLKDVTAEGWGSLAAFIALGYTVGGATAKWWLRRASRGHAQLRVGIEAVAATMPSGRVQFSRFYFVITSEGSAVARNVRLRLAEEHRDQGEAKDDRWRNTVASGLGVPLPRIHPGQRVEFEAFMPPGGPFHFDVVLSWDDSRRQRRQETSTIYMPRPPR